MNVKTGVLRDQLSRYLKRVRQTGDTIVVMDRDVPVAEIRPYSGQSSKAPASVWARRALLEEQSGSLADDFELPTRQTIRSKHDNPLD